ncbi:MAG: tetratricopeptide repeat protein [Candidatus Eisenbacteria bacterium]
MSRKERILILLLLLAGIAIRLAYLAEIRDNPFFESPLLDEAVHYRWASQLARGEPWFPDEPFFRAPLYPYFLSLLLRIGKGGLLFPRIVQLLIGATLPVILYGLGRGAVGRTAAAAGAFLLLFYGLAYYFDAGLLIVPILLPLVLLHLGALLRLAVRPGRGTGLAAGLLLGLAAVARPNILLFGALAPLLFLIDREGRRNAARWLIPYIAGALLPIAPVFLHNAGAGDPVLVSWQGGTNLWIGNNPESDGMTAIAPGTEGTWWGGYGDMIRIAEEKAGRPLRRSEVSSYWFRRTLRFFRDDPGAAARLMAKKAYLLVNDFEVSNNQGIYFFRRYSKVLDRLMNLGFGVLFPLAAAGIILVRWDRRVRLLLLFLAAYGLSVVLFFVTARYRMPVVAVLPLFAGVALTRWVRIPRTGADRRTLVSIAIFAAAALLSNSNLTGLERDRFAQGHYNVGVVHLTARRFEEAIPHFREALDEEPAYRNARYNLGLCYSYLDRREEAEEELSAVVRDHPRFAAARLALASVLERRGDREGALRQVVEGLKIEPRSPDLLAARDRLLRTREGS